MGTRGLTKVISPIGEVVVAQYGQWDHYPSGQGLNVLRFISQYGILENFKPCLSKVSFISEDEVSKLTAPHGNQWDSFYPQFSRNTGTDILKVIYYSSGYVPLVDSSDFETDDLFCEGIYTLDFQNHKFISNCGKVVEFDFENLPSEEDYLKSFEGGA
jgi:hypothetical protein